MADIRLAVAHLQAYAPLVESVLPLLVQAYAPFGVNFILEPRRVLGFDPKDDKGWNKVIDALTRQSVQRNPPSPAHVVFAETPTGYDRSINGQLMTRERGVCAIFLGAYSFQTPTPFQRIDLVAQVLIHEVGHLMNLTHGDAYKSGGYSDALMPTSDRQQQQLADAWRAAIADAADGNEPALHAPNPMLTYPFGAQCRACLRAAAGDPSWWPWRSAFRGDFDIAVEDRDRSLSLAISNVGRGQPLRAGHGIDFTLEIRNNGSQPVPIPAHIGVEFGNLVVSSRQPGEDAEHFFAPDSYRCSSARQNILPGAIAYRSFSLIPRAGQHFLGQEGEQILKVRLNGSDGDARHQLGAAELELQVQASADAQTPVAVATQLIGAATGASTLPERAAFQHLDLLEAQSSVAFHARYKLALLHEGKERTRLLRQCLGAEVPTAIRHRAGRRLVLDELKAGRMKSGPSKAWRRAFDRPEDAEFFETLDRMRDGWNALSPLANR